jgi:arginyl-tRNA synthetase
VQYAHARINQLIDKKKDEYVFTSSFKDLVLPAERELIITLNSYKQLIESISNNYEVHRLNTYLIQLARSYHSYYTNNKIIDSENKKLSIQRY